MAKMTVVYEGPANTFDGVPNAQGQEFSLTEEQIARLRAGGHRFRSADKRKKLPDPEPPPPEPEETEG